MEERKTLTLCDKGDCCPEVRVEEGVVKFKFDDDGNSMTINEFRILLARGQEILP